MKKPMTVFIISILTTFSSYAFSPQEVKEIGLNPDSDNQLALYTFLYEIGLKNKMSGGEFLGKGTCVDFNKKGPNSFQLVIGMKDAPFKTGSHKLETNKNEYSKMSNLIKLTDQFFKQARKKDGGKSNFTPKLEIEGYADPQHNKQNPNASSRENNYKLAGLRTNEIKNTFFKGYKTDESPYISEDLDILKNAPQNKEDFKCDKRRGIVLKFDVDPSISFQGTPGSYSLGFNTIKGLDQKKMNLASVLDASDTNSIKDLPKECQRKGSKIYQHQASVIGNYLKKYVSDNSNKLKQISNKILKECTSKPHLKICKIESLQKIQNEDLKTAKGTYKLSSYLLEVRNSKTLLKEILSPSENSTLTRVMNVATVGTLDKSLGGSSANQAAKNYDIIKNIINKKSPKGKGLPPWKYYLGHKFGAYFTSCFSNELYYENNFSKYTKNLKNLRNKDTGMVKLSFNSENIPTIKKKNGEFQTAKGNAFKEFKGYGCQACGHGLHYNNKTNTMEVHNRSNRKDHSNDPRLRTMESGKIVLPKQEEEDIFNNFTNKTGVSTGSMKIAEHMSPSVYIIKDCNPMNISTSERIRMDQFDKNGEVIKEIKLGENDCLFQPDIVSSCNAVPQGNSENSENEDGQKASVYSLLAGKYLDINLKKGIESFANELNKDLVKSCGHDDLVRSTDHNKLIESIRCKSEGVSVLPTPGKIAAGDCPEVKKVVDSIPDSEKIK